MVATTIRVRRTKTYQEIQEQVERIYRLYGQGYGSDKMLRDCDDKVYVIITRIEY